MTKIKICGLKRPEDIICVNQYLPEYAGFVFAESRRKVSDEMAEELSRQLDEKITPVGVFVNEPIEHIVELVRKKIIRIVQLHGDEEESYIIRLKRELETNTKEKAAIIKAVRVQDQNQIRKAEKLSCDYLLFDTWQKDSYGGSGKTFDKALLPEKISRPYFLAGGLDDENVQENIKICHPYAVDVSSAVETDGKKDPEKIRRFIERVREDE